MSDMKIKPRLRFLEFIDELKTNELGKLGRFVGGGTPDKENNSYWNGNIPWISSSDLYENDINKITISRKISKEAIKGSATKLIPVNSVIFISRVGVGKLAVNTEDLCTSQDFTNFIPNKINNRFIGAFFQKNKHLLVRYSQGTSIKGITSNELKKIKIFHPSEKEQQKIADFLSSLDKKISMLKNKMQLLSQYKKGVMQQLLSQQIRFNDENGETFPDWKIEPVGNYLEEYKERVAVDTAIPVLTSSRTGLYLQQRKVINEGEYGVVPKGYFTYRHMSDDLVFKFNLNRIWDKGAVSKEYPVFKTVGMNSYFLELCLNEGNDFKRFAIQQKVGGTRTRLYYKNLVKLKLHTPSLKEQNKIADFLQAIDKKIKLVEKQIEHTQTFKKGLLQQMFV